MIQNNVDLSLIVAIDRNRAIGKDGRLPWRMPSDLMRFKKLTTVAGTVIMGRRTYDSILSKNGAPLPGRRTIVMSRGLLDSPHEETEVASSVEAVYKRLALENKRACVIGGAEIYQLFLPLINRISLTRVDACTEGDVFFPKVAGRWRCIGASDNRLWGQKDEYSSAFFTFERVHWNSSMQERNQEETAP